MRAAALAVKAALLALLLYAVVRPELPQFAGKAMGTRLLTLGVVVVVVPLLWRLWPGGRRSGRPYPWAADLCFVAPFLMDTAANAVDLYDGVSWFDDAMHLATWVPWVVAFGLLLHYAPPVPRWAHFGLVLGFGAATHIVWELGEYVTFIRDSPELATAYTDTLGDLGMSLSGSLLGALLAVTALWGAGRDAARLTPP